MNIKKVAVANLILFVLLFSIVTAYAQETSDSNNKKTELSEIKNKSRVYVEVAEAGLKQKIENYFKNNSRFVVVSNLKDAELIYTAGTNREARPSFGTPENRTDLPRLPVSDGAGLVNPQTTNQLLNYENELHQKSSAKVYYDQPNGERVIVWKEEVLSINKSTEPGAYVQFQQGKNDELYLAKRFVKKAKANK